MTGSLVCYGRFVVASEWEAMEDGTLGEAINPWGAEMFRITDEMEPETASEEAAFGKWLDQTSERERRAPGPDPRRGRRDPDAVVDRAVLHQRDRGHLPPRLRRQRGARRPSRASTWAASCR